MSEPIRPKGGGVPAQTPEIPVLERKVGLQAETSDLGIGRELRNMASTPSFMGELASKITVGSAKKQAQIVGQYLGQNPSGDTLPPITDFDKWAADSYNTQAAATLNLQAQSMMNKADEALAANFKLSGSDIQKYNQSMAEGAENIFKYAPSDIKGELRNNFASSLMAKNHSYNLQIQTQNKQDTQDTLSVSNSHASKDAFDNSVAGTIDRDYLKNFKDDLDKQASSGAITKKQADAWYQEAKVNYYSGQNTRDAIAAKAAGGGKLETYLRGMDSSLPKDVSASERVAITQNVLSYMGKVHAAESQDNQLILSQLKRSLYEGTLTGGQLFSAETKLSPTEYNDFISSMYGHNGTESKAQKAITDLANNFGNIYAFNSAKPETRNNALEYLTNVQMQKTPGADRFQVETGIVKGGGGEVPQYTSKLDTMIKRGAVNEAASASRAFESISSNPNTASNIAGLTKEARAVQSVFKNLTDAHVPANEALAQARQQVIGKTKEQQEAMQDKWDDIVKNHYKTPNEKESLAREMVGASSGWFGFGKGDVPNLPAISNKIMSVMESNYKLTDNLEAAKEMTRKEMKRVYGSTSVNGREQITYLPLEQTIGIGEDGASIVNYDVVRNLTPQLQPTKDAYDKGNIEYYFDIKSGEHGEPIVEKVYRSKEAFNPTLTPEGLIEKGNINLENRKILKNKDNSESSVSTMTTEIDGKIYLLPTVIDGNRLSEEDAINHFKNTHEHMGVFKSQRDADLYDEALHEKMGWIGRQNVWPKYYKGGLKETYALQTVASDMLQLSNDQANPISGYYNTQLIDKKGNVQEFATVTDGNVHTLGYRPDVRWIRDAYTQMKASPLESSIAAFQKAQIDDALEKFKGFSNRANRSVLESKIPSSELRDNNGS